MAKNWSVDLVPWYHGTRDPVIKARIQRCWLRSLGTFQATCFLQSSWSLQGCWPGGREPPPNVPPARWAPPPVVNVPPRRRLCPHRSARAGSTRRGPRGLRLTPRSLLRRVENVCAVLCRSGSLTPPCRRHGGPPPTSAALARYAAVGGAPRSGEGKGTYWTPPFRGREGAPIASGPF